MLDLLRQSGLDKLKVGLKSSPLVDDLLDSGMIDFKHFGNPILDSSVSQRFFLTALMINTG